MHIRSRFGNAFVTCEPTMIRRWILHQSTSLAKSQKAVEAHGCKPWVANLSIVPHTLGILTANITYCIMLLEYVKSVPSECVPSIIVQGWLKTVLLILFRCKIYTLDRKAEEREWFHLRVNYSINTGTAHMILKKASSTPKHWWNSE